jgi:hypothetical protein
VCRLDPAARLPDWVPASGELISVTRTRQELSVVVPESTVPADVTAERGWLALTVVGPLDFALVGVLASLAGALAAAAVPILALSTYDTDLLLVRQDDAPNVVKTLGQVADVSALGPALRSRWGRGMEHREPHPPGRYDPP